MFPQEVECYDLLGSDFTTHLAKGAAAVAIRNPMPAQRGCKALGILVLGFRV